MEQEEQTEERNGGLSIAELESFTDEYGHRHAVNMQRPPLCGGQGCVFFTNDERFAGKICFAPGGEERLSRDVRANGAFRRLRLLPIPQEAHVTLPLAMLEEYEGYVMQLLDGMVSFQEGLCGEEEAELPALFDGLPEAVRTRLSRRIASGGARRILMAYMKAACSLALLHAQGLVYCDFSERNAFLSKNPAYHHVWLIDADNIAYEEDVERDGRRIYTPGIGAPEVVRDDVASPCSFWSDCYAFAHALFQRLYLQHPYEGVRYQELADAEDLSDEAEVARNEGRLAWVLDEDDDSNAQSVQLALPFLLTPQLRRLFQETFSEESREADECVRPTMMEWAAALAHAYDNVVRGTCGLDAVMDGDAFGVSPWDDAPVRAIRATSWRRTRRGWRRLWQVTHEAVDGLALPYRLIRGFSCSGVEKAAFTLHDEGGRWRLDTRFTARTMEGSSDGRTFAPGFRFYLAGPRYIVHIVTQDGRDIRMEVEMA